ncbi:MAG: hypothetical protein ACREXP_08645 [Steroidobacteraceae bacterium]
MELNLTPHCEATVGIAHGERRLQSRPTERYRHPLRVGSAPSDHLIMAHVLKGDTKRSNCVIRSVAVPASKRSSRLAGSRAISTGTANRSRIDCQNGVRKKSSLHHVRHRPSVRCGIVNSAHSARPAAPPRGDPNISTTATYTRRPKNRTEAGVARFWQRPQVKLNREE